ncbi:hypothetical protein ELH66_08240 [Rhizobium ruizarguesonis]|uniref:hypothetical protein n=1 Tax=Rhizobium ruizarguesonis TaxID=2081791 RepID=UPI00102FBE19|nr:hypothetical protein [Rhizobium ruizarguesonis]TBA20984.1 hypothetical protein ELH66_08240 [Rhizobium ruizarguesonis]
MSSSSSALYRVRQLVDNDGAIVTDVAEEAESSSGYAHPKEVRNAKLRLGGVDSFWLATNVKTDRKFSSSAKPAAPPLFPSASATLSLIGRIKGGSGLDFTSPFSEIVKNAKIEGIAFGAAIRVPIAIGPIGGDHERLVRDLHEGKLSVDVRNTVDAIEVRPDVYMISGFVRLSSGHYSLAPDTRIRAAPTVSVAGSIGTTRLPSGVLVFGAPVRWSHETAMDLRSNAEILASAEEWLTRIQTAGSLSGHGTARGPAELLRAFAVSSVSAEERDDLESAVRVLSGREALLDILPELVKRDGSWRTRLQEFERTEQDRLRTEIRTRLADEAEQETARIAELREQILDAEGRLAVISHREVLLRNETEQHDARLRDKIAEAVQAVGGASQDATQKLRQEIADLRNELEHRDHRSPTEPPPVPLASLDPEPMPEAPRAGHETLDDATDEQRLSVMRELVSSTGLTIGVLVAVLLHSTEDVPVLVGNGSAGIAADIVTAMGGDSAAVVFCDPTRISLFDLVRDDANGFGRAIEAANANPDVIVPVALCGLTNGPCEYWVPQLVEMRRIGRLPANLALIASAGTDGLRVSVPKSVLRYLFPMAVERTDFRSKVEYAGSWTPFAADGARIQDAIRILRTKSVQPALVGRIADLLSRAPAAVDQNEAASALVGEQAWVAAWRDGADHDLIQHFQNLGN